MAHYDLTHLRQPEHQDVAGPIQDDEALFLYAIIRGMRLRRVLEMGGLSGYSARNFLAAVGPVGRVYTVDLRLVPTLAENHVSIAKDAREIVPDDVDGAPLDLVFFDCHVYDAQMETLARLEAANLVHPRTVLALHDTHVHPMKRRPIHYEADGGWVHQPVERRMVNALHEAGWDAFCLHTDLSVHNENFPVRHGVVVMQRFRPLTV